MAKRKNRAGWRLVAATGVIFASFAVGGAIGGVFGHLAGAPYDHTDDSFDVVREACNEIWGIAAGLVVGMSLGLEWSYVIVSEGRRNQNGPA